MVRRPPRSTLFPTRRSSDLVQAQDVPVQGRRTQGKKLLKLKGGDRVAQVTRAAGDRSPRSGRSEEHTSELQSQSNLVCRLLLEKKKTRPLRQEGIPSTAERR